MSNYKPRIESNNLDLTSILSTINELPEAGPSVETCTVVLSGAVEYCVVTTYDNNVITSHYYTFSSSGDLAAPVELTNVVCNSIMIIKSNAGIPSFDIDEEIQLLKKVSEQLPIFSAPTQFGSYNIRAERANVGGSD